MIRSATSVHPRSSRRVLDEHRELVAAQSRHRVGRAHAGEQPPRGLDEQRVTRAVPETVVDGLEVVEIEEQQRARRLRCACDARQRVLHAVAQQRAVRQPGQRVVECLVRELRFERCPLAHVAGVEDDAAHGRIVQQVHADALDRAPRAVAVPHAPVDGTSAPPPSMVRRRNTCTVARRPGGPTP